LRQGFGGPEAPEKPVPEGVWAAFVHHINGVFATDIMGLTLKI
jgi:hypothetical protein